ncbi:MAG: hypothetical protein ACXADU_18140 [Promethearchaeota archaeon]
MFRDFMGHRRECPARVPSQKQEESPRGRGKGLFYHHLSYV